MTTKYDLKNNFRKYENVKSNLIMEQRTSVKPNVSIMIPTFRRPKLIREAIDSVVRQKTSISFEVVIVDNDSEGTYENELIDIVQSYSNINIKYYKNEKNIGMFGNWNRCIELASSSLISILNDDDILNDYWLDTAYENIDHESFSGSLSYRFSDLIEVETLRKICPSNIKVKTVTSEDIFYGMWTNGSLGVLFYRDIALSIGGFDENLYPMSDWHFFFKYSQVKPLKLIKSSFVYNRWQNNESMKLDVVIAQIRTNFDFRNYMIDFYYGNDYSYSRLKSQFFRDILCVKAMKLAKKRYLDYKLYDDLNYIGLGVLKYIIYSKIPYRTLKYIFRIL